MITFLALASRRAGRRLRCGFFPLALGLLLGAVVDDHHPAHKAECRHQQEFDAQGEFVGRGREVIEEGGYGNGQDPAAQFDCLVANARGR